MLYSNIRKWNRYKLNDRKNEFIEGYKSVCQDDCDFIDYDYTSKKANCSCADKESSLIFEDMNINKSKLYQNFKDIRNIANIKILICYEVLFTKRDILYNIGSYTIIADIIFHLICIFLFYTKHKKILKIKIQEIALKIRNSGKKKVKKKKKKKLTNRTSKNNINKEDIDSEKASNECNTNILSFKKNYGKRNLRENNLNERIKAIEINIDNNLENNILPNNGSSKEKKIKKIWKKKLKINLEEK